MFKLGLIINPLAGVGGSVALKGSDGANIVQEALQRGAKPKAQERALQTLATVTSAIKEASRDCQMFTCAGDMGEAVALQAGFSPTVVFQGASPSSAADTEAAVTKLLELSLDLILFAGGDGTARDVCRILSAAKNNNQLIPPVLGIPAGVKIHSGVYAVSPSAAGELVAAMIRGEVTSISEGEVRDIDEQLFREGKVDSRWYGEMKIPVETRYVQQVKCGGKEKEELVLVDMAHYLQDLMADVDEDTHFIMGSGSTVAALMDEFGLENTLLGVDVVQQNNVLLQDATEAQLWQLIENSSATFKLVVTIIGGQGHLLGRGNQQLSPRIINAIGLDNIIIVATKTKLESLNQRPIIVDSGDRVLDEALAGTREIVTGYEDFVYYRVACDYR